MQFLSRKTRVITQRLRCFRVRTRQERSVVRLQNKGLDLLRCAAPHAERITVG